MTHSVSYSDDWEFADWKMFQKVLFRLQKRIFKAIREGDMARARRIQKLILSSYAARMLAIRQVTQLNQGKKTAGIDGKKSLTFKERFQLEETLKQHTKTWIHQGLREIPIPKKDGTKRILAERGMEISQKKTKVTASKKGFDFLGWHFYVQKYNGKFKSTPSVDNFQAFRSKVKHIINNSNYGASTKVTKLAPVVRGWRNYHKYCKMDGSRFSLWHLAHRTFKVFLKQKTISRHKAKEMVKIAFPNINYSENRFSNVKGNKSPFDGDINYWSKRNSILYDGGTSNALRKQNHTCGHCGLKFLDEEKVELHHIDGNHNNWDYKNLLAIHRSCHHYIHTGKSRKD